MKLTEMSIGAFLEAVRSPAPVPGGGSSAALAGATGASLLTMVAAMPKHRATSEADTAALRTAGEKCAGIGGELTRLINEDSDAYGRVMAAYRLPKSSEGEKDERSAAIQAALMTATEVPLAVMGRAVEALTAAATVGRLGNPNASSDVGVAVELLAAACRGAALNVDINLGQIKDARYAGRVREDAERLSARCDEAAAAAHRALGRTSERE
jgi:formiminotetrahydrofolate cyclodeaminase